MGTTRWSDDHYHERARIRAAEGKSAFDYDDAVRHMPESKRKVHQALDPRGVAFRESRDSETHPTSRAVGVLFDVTGSMREVPRILQANLPKLMDLLIDKDYLEHPQILIGGIGDATCDRAPLQIGQFESGNEIEDDLGRLYLEGGGGGHITESYELAMYFMAHHTSIDCFEKRRERGYLFLIGDEAPYGSVKSREVKRFIGDNVQANLPTREVLATLQRMYHVYFVIPKMTSGWDNEEIHSRWVKLLGQNVLRLEDPAAICELIGATVGLAEGRVDLDSLESELRESGSSSRAARAVRKVLTAGMSRNAATPGAGTINVDDLR
jgi:hypothetical protein